MAIIQKPPFPSQLNRGHSLSQGLVGCWLMNEAGGAGITDLVYQEYCPLINNTTGNPTSSNRWSVNKKGVQIGNLGQYESFRIAAAGARPRFKVQSHTIVALVKCTAVASNQLIFSRDYITTSGYEWAIQNSKFSYAYYDTGVRGWYELSTPPITDYVLLGLIWNQKAGLASCYLNGAFSSSVATTTGTIFHEDTRLTRLGNGGYLDGVQFRGSIVFFYFYSRALSPSEIQALYTAPYQFIQPIRRKFYSIPAGVTADLSGSILGANEGDIVAGGKQIVLILSGDTWITAGAASFDLQRQNIINGITSAQSETFGWNLVPKVLQSVAGVVRTDSTTVTITLDAFATYNIANNETITATIPGTALVGGNPVVASPTFTITPITVSSILHSSRFALMGVG